MFCKQHLNGCKCFLPKIAPKMHVKIQTQLFIQNIIGSPREFTNVGKTLSTTNEDKYLKYQVSLVNN